jgi:hypothetical protein
MYLILIFRNLGYSYSSVSVEVRKGHCDYEETICMGLVKYRWKQRKTKHCREKC